MIAHQGHVVSGIKGFRFLEDNNLRQYDDVNKPVVLFGAAYPKSDKTRDYILKYHKGLIIVYWMGLDARVVKETKVWNRENIINITTIRPIRDTLAKKGIDCKMIRPGKTPPANALKKGGKIYVYNDGKEYHGYDKYGINKANKVKTDHPILMLRNNIPKEKWYAGECDKYYSQCFIGLALGEYSGGGITTRELGLRGIKVVTNIFDYPNCVRFETIQDIERIINKESLTIGQADHELAGRVYGYCANEMKGFDLSKLLI